MDSRVARRYARALFGAAKQEDILEPVEQDLDGIYGALQANPTFRKFLASPEVSSDEKRNLVDRLFSDRVTALTMSLLRLLLEKRRETEFDLVRLEYQTLRREHDNVTYAVVTSGRPLDEAQQRAVVDKVARFTGKRVEAEFEVDPRVIGGVKVAYDNNVLDGTVRGSLSRLRETLVYDLLKQN